MYVRLTREMEAELERSREQTRNGWRIAESVGMPQSAAEKLAEIVRLEMQFYCADFMRGLSVAYHAQKWLETGNPHHIDAAVHLCALSGIAPPPALAVEVARVAEKRLSGTISSGTAGKIIRAGVLDRALTLMAVLRAAGASLEVAASKAAQYLADTAAPHGFKASTLERRYSEKYLRGNPSPESVMHQAWTEHPPEVKAQRAAILAAIPESGPSLKGDRR